MTNYFNDWVEVSDISDGARVKKWVLKNNQLYLYKQNKLHTNGEPTTENYSELIAMRIADALGIPNVRIELLENAILSKVEWDVELKSFIELSEEFSHSFHLSNLSTFNISTLLNETTNIYWREVATMLLFDAVIGNSDRHPGNFLYNERKGFYPLFDNGSSLCCYIEEDKLESYIKDELRFKSLCLSKSKPVLRDDSKITHYDLVKILNRRYPILVSDFTKQLSKLDIESILTDLEISSNRKLLLIKFINERKRWFNE